MTKLSKRARQEALRRQKRRQRLIWGMGAAGALLLIVAAVLSWPSPTNMEIDPFDADAVALGKQVYELHCGSCHGENLEGEANWRDPNPDGLLRAPPHDETGHTWHHDDAYLIESVELGGARLSAGSGISAMPAYDKILTDEEITAVFAYIKSAWPPDILTAQAQR